MKLKPKEDFYALICVDKYVENKKWRDLLCGVYATKKEAQKAAAEVKDCPLRHKIKPVKVQVEWKP